VRATAPGILVTQECTDPSSDPDKSMFDCVGYPYRAASLEPGRRREEGPGTRRLPELAGALTARAGAPATSAAGRAGASVARGGLAPRRRETLAAVPGGPRDRGRVVWWPASQRPSERRERRWDAEPPAGAAGGGGGGAHRVEQVGGRGPQPGSGWCEKQ